MPTNNRQVNILLNQVNGSYLLYLIEDGITISIKTMSIYHEIDGVVSNWIHNRNY